MLLIGGRSGVGKSSVARECHAALGAAGVRHCLIDGDMLDMVSPTPWVHGLAERNPTAMWTNYRILGYRRLIFINSACVLPTEAAKHAAAIDEPRVGPRLVELTVWISITRPSSHLPGVSYRLQQLTFESPASHYLRLTDGRVAHPPHQVAGPPLADAGARIAQRTRDRRGQRRFRRRWRRVSTWEMRSLRLNRARW